MELPLVEALSEGLVELRVAGAGPGVTSRIEVRLINKSGQPLEIIIPRGTQFVPEDAGRQTMVTTTDTVVNLGGGSTVERTIIPTICGSWFGWTPPPPDGGGAYHVVDGVSPFTHVFDAVDSVTPQLVPFANRIGMPVDMFKDSIRQYTSWVLLGTPPGGNNDDVSTTVEQPKLPPAEAFHQDIPHGTFTQDTIVDILTPQLTPRGATPDQVNFFATTFWEGVDTTVKHLDSTQPAARSEILQAANDSVPAGNGRPKTIEQIQAEQWDNPPPPATVIRRPVYRKPNRDLQELFDKLTQINEWIAELEGDQAGTTRKENAFLTALKEATDFNWSSFDEKTFAYERRDDVYRLIELYQTRGAQAVNDAIYNQKLDYMFKTVTTEADFAGGIAGGELVAHTGKFLDTQLGSPSGRTGFESFSGERPTAEGPGTSSETVRITPEQQGPGATSETVRMTPEQQGIGGQSETVRMTPEQQGPGAQSETVVEGSSGGGDENLSVRDYALLEPKPTAGQEAISIEVRGRNYDKVGGGSTPAEQAHYQEVRARDVERLRQAGPEFWDAIDNPETRAYLEQMRDSG